MDHSHHHVMHTDPTATPNPMGMDHMNHRHDGHDHGDGSDDGSSGSSHMMSMYVSSSFIN